MESCGGGGEGSDLHCGQSFCPLCGLREAVKEAVSGASVGVNEAGGDRETGRAGDDN